MHYLPLWVVIVVPLTALIVGVVLSPGARRVFGDSGDSDESTDGLATGSTSEPTGEARDAVDAEEAEAEADADDQEQDQDERKDTASDFRNLIAPVVTITSLVLSFALVNTWASFQNAAVKAHAEAVAVDYQGDLAQLLPDATQRRDLEATLVCYARAISGPEWAIMGTGGDVTADEVDPWTDQLAATAGELITKTGPGTPVGREFLSADRERAAARSTRLVQARPSIPEPIVLFLLAAVSASIVALAFSNLPSNRTWLHITGLVVVATMLTGLLVVITELDSPYWGLIDTEPTDMTRVAAAEASDFAQQYPGVHLPCDDSGRQLTP